MERAEVDFNRDVYCVMGLPIDAVSMQEAVQRVRDAAFNRKSCVIATPNLNFVMMAREDEAFRNSVLRSDLVLADGMPLVWVARLLGLPIRERVSGAGLFENLLKHPGPPVSVYFFGGPEGAAETACRRMNLQKDGGLRCVGFESPGFGTVEEMSSEEHIAKINLSGAQFVIVSLGAKKGQAWIERNRGRLDAPVICHLGAVINFVAGTVNRAPRWIQAIGGEWLWRIKEEPGLWRRYRRDGTLLIGLVFSQLLPLLVHTRLRTVWRRADHDFELGVAQVSRRTLLTPQGVCSQQNLEPLRKALVDARRSGNPLDVNLASASYVDSAFVGLMQLVWGASGCGTLKFVGASRHLARTLALNGSSWLLNEDSRNEG